VVSVTAVPDPLGDHRDADLRRAFPHLVRPYKEHWVVDLAENADLPRHHARKLRAARAAVELERADCPAQWAGEFAALYSGLIARHGIEGAARFSCTSLARQMALPGFDAFRARIDDETVAMMLFVTNGSDAYYHLGAANERGYAAAASYALMAAALDHFAARGFARLLLGSGAGIEAESASGLDRFKKGWATRSVPGYLCGRIADLGAYERLSAGREAIYFPAYRAPTAGSQ